ncbi:MAG: c-type cytochrome [Planctomycetes bacterium]|nr:c-type cytochrome [Planctomycetota bacterium]
MLTHIVGSCGALALLSLTLGGDPVPANALLSAVAPVAVAQDPKPLPKVRIDYTMVKTLFGKDPASDEKAGPFGLGQARASTAEEVALGKALYHEKHLSKNGNLSCASCHDLANYGVDGKPTSPGTDGKNGDRNTPTTWNAFRHFRQFWDGRASTVEEQSSMPVMNPVEHGVADEAQLVAKMKEKAELVDGFKKAFPADADPVSVANFRLAVGAFERTLVTRSKWDEYLDGNQRALNNDELYGLKTFITVGCTTCHMTRLLGGNMYQKNGLLKPYAHLEDTGRMQVTKSEADKHFFKVPSLLNVEKTAPYCHDGKVATLEEAIKMMADIQLGKTLTDEELRGLVAFMKALTGKLPEEHAAAK